MGKCDICGKSIKYNRYIKYRKKIYCMECWRIFQEQKEKRKNKKQFTEEVDLKELED